MTMSGMTDLLSPLLASLDSEEEAFWCFTHLVEGTAFFKPAKDHVSVEQQLVRATLPPTCIIDILVHIPYLLDYTPPLFAS